MRVVAGTTCCPTMHYAATNGRTASDAHYALLAPLQIFGGTWTPLVPRRRFPPSPRNGIPVRRCWLREICDPAIASYWSKKQIAEAQALEQATRGRRGVSVVCGDGYAALKTYLPPRENRGLVLIDPPAESENEFIQVERALLHGLSRWPNGIFALWYPIKLGRGGAQRLQLSLQNSGFEKVAAGGAERAASRFAAGLERLRLAHRQSTLAVR